MLLKVQQAALAFIIGYVLMGIVDDYKRAYPHDQYSGKRNPVTGVGCCGGDDCKPVSVDRVVETKDEFILDGVWHFVKDEAMQSTDGQYHACIWGGKPRCFFYPANV